jgi:glutamine amidotransferase
MITIVDYGLGNLGSIFNMFKKLNAKSEIVSDPDKIAKSTKILLPGVGAFDAAMQKINEKGLLEVLNKKATVEKVPFLGICLGMQLLTEGSEEGILTGLCFLKGQTKKFSFDEGSLKIPHMGWNVVNLKNDSPLTKGMETEEQRFYFVHSYYVKCTNPANVIGQTHYGFDFDCAIQNDNVFGVQFHPEKSHRFGMKLLKNFAEL